jgi:hypothetical protein
MTELAAAGIAALQLVFAAHLNCLASPGTLVGHLVTNGGGSNPIVYALTGGDIGDFAIKANTIVVGKSGIARAHCGQTQTVTASATQSDLTLGKYVLTSGAVALDGGFGYWGTSPAVQAYPINRGLGQQWQWNGSTFASVIVLSNDAGKQDGHLCTGCGAYLADAGNGSATEKPTGDSFMVLAVDGGYTIQSLRTGNYLSLGTNGALAFGATQTVWTASAP